MLPHEKRPEQSVSLLVGVPSHGPDSIQKTRTGAHCMKLLLRVPSELQAPAPFPCMVRGLVDPLGCTVT